MLCPKALILVRESAAFFERAMLLRSIKKEDTIFNEVLFNIYFLKAK
jgi:hypothetical protein